MPLILRFELVHVENVDDSQHQVSISEVLRQALRVTPNVHHDVLLTRVQLLRAIIILLLREECRVLTLVILEGAKGTLRDIRVDLVLVVVA